ncbi:MAG: head completion protein [Bacilli bacterium]|nr:head completion protein [Bacilli bacterium]
MSYKGHYTVINKHKYLGDCTKIRFLSLWEYSLMKYLDHCPSVAKWNSEGAKIPYICPTDGRQHTYLIDFYIILNNGKKLLVEVKPKKQCSAPKEPKRKTQRYLTEQFYWVKNQAKWAAAEQFALFNNAEFQVWTEIELRKLGIKIL